MTKKMIDAEAINAIFQGILEKRSYNIMGVEYPVDVPVLRNLSHKINELATPAPEPQESIFDADGWCWDLEKMPMDDDLHFLIESPREMLGAKPDGNKYFYQRIGIVDCINEDLGENECAGDHIIAWRPLPPIPKEAKE